MFLHLCRTTCKYKSLTPFTTIFNYTLRKPHSTFYTFYSTESSNADLDLKATETLTTLFQVPSEERKNLWYVEVEKNLKIASFRGDFKPQIIQGLDDFFYLRLSLPRYGDRFAKFSLSDKTLLQFCLQYGCGVIFFSDPKHADKINFEDVQYSLTLGQVYSLYKYKSFLGDPTDLYEIENKKQHKSLVHYPTEQFIKPTSDMIPAEIREYLSTFLTFKPHIPKVAMKVIPENTAKALPSRTLVFNLSNEDFSTEEQTKDFLQYLRWFLPPSRYVSLFQSSKQVIETVEAPDSPFIPITAQNNQNKI